MNRDDHVTEIYACSILEEELRHLYGDEVKRGVVHFIDSRLHMRPEELRKTIRKELETGAEATGKVLVYGDCHAYMEDDTDGNTVRTKGLNCIELVLGKRMYQILRREGAFFLLPEWTHRWRTIFQTELGLTSAEMTRAFMGDMHRKLVFLDTGVVPVPTDVLQQIKAYVDLPLEIRSVELSHLKKVVDMALEEAEKA